MANLNIGEAAALSPAMNFDLTSPVMKGINLGMQEKAAEAKALAARLKKNKILALDTSNIHPTLRGDAEKLAYETTAQMKMAADAGEDPMSYKNLGQQKINEVQSESKRRFELEKANPNDYVMDQEAMTLFSQGKSKEAKDLLEKKGYDPQLIAAINPETTLFLPKNVNIKQELSKKYGYSDNPGLYEPDRTEKVLAFGKERQLMKLNDQAANAASLEMAGNTDVQAKILKDFPTQFKTSLSKVMLNNPGIDPNVARGKAFVDVIKDPTNALLPTHELLDQPKNKFTINNYGNGADRVKGELGTHTIHLNNISELGSKEFSYETKGFGLNPQKIGMPPADLIPTSGKRTKNDVGVKDFKSGYVTSLPVNNSKKNIYIIDEKTRKVIDKVVPGEVVPSNYLDKIKNNRSLVSFMPVAVYTKEVDANGKKVEKSYYSRLDVGDTNVFADSEVKSGQQRDIVQGLKLYSDEENKRNGLGRHAAPRPAEKGKPSGQSRVNTSFKGAPKGGFN